MVAIRKKMSMQSIIKLIVLGVLNLKKIMLLGGSVVKIQMKTYGKFSWHNSLRDKVRRFGVIGSRDNTNTIATPCF